MSANKLGISGFAFELVNGSDIQNQTATRHEIKTANPHSNYHDLGQLCRIQPDTAKEYRQTYEDMEKYVRSNFSDCQRETGSFDPFKMTADHAVAYLEHRAEEACRVNEIGGYDNKGGIHAARFENLCSMIEKIPAFFSRPDGKYADQFRSMAPAWSTLHAKIQELKSSAFVAEIASTPKETRAYNNPAAVVDAVKGLNTPLAERSGFVAEMQCRLGLRVDNARCFTLNANGTISFFSKGHMPHENYKIPADLYAKAVELNDGQLGKCEIVAYRTYLTHVQAACGAVGEKYSGSHSFRHSYAKGRYNELRAEGKSAAHAKAIVSEELFHRRLDVVEVYLR